MSDKLSVLDDWLTLRDLPRAELEHRFALNEGQIDENVSYQRLAHLTRLHNAATHPGYFYFRGEHLELLYISGGPEFVIVTSQTLLEQLGPPKMDLASRAGKRARMFVYPERGIAFSSEGHKVQFLEIFPLSTEDIYLSRIYLAPGAFIE